jgi:hypothetical protein
VELPKLLVEEGAVATDDWNQLASLDVLQPSDAVVASGRQ